MAIKDNLLNSIIPILSGSSLLEQSHLLMVLNRLESLSYTLKATDDWMIGFAVQKVENTIKNETNLDHIPDGLLNIAVNMICGEFLFSLKQSGQLEDFDLETAVKTVQSGDTTVTFAVEKSSMTPEQRLNHLLSYLINDGRSEFICYRKIRW